MRGGDFYIGGGEGSGSGSGVGEGKGGEGGGGGGDDAKGGAGGEESGSGSGLQGLSSPARHRRVQRANSSGECQTICVNLFFITFSYLLFILTLYSLPPLHPHSSPTPLGW